MIDKEMLTKLYWEDRLSFRLIGEKLGVTSECIRNHFKKNNIPIRSLSDACSNSYKTGVRKPSNNFVSDKSLLITQGRKGGLATKNRYGIVHYRKIGAIGAATTISLNLHNNNLPTLEKGTEVYEKYITNRRKAMNTPQYKNKLREAMSSPEYKTKQSINKKLLWQTDGFRAKVLARLSDAMHTDEYRNKKRLETLARWQDLEFAAKVIKSWRNKPTKPELKTMALLDNIFPGEWEYTGDHSRADFTHRKLPTVILVNGRHWHPASDEEKQIQYFNNLDHRCLVIWEEELSNEESLKQKLRKWQLNFELSGRS